MDELTTTETAPIEDMGLLKDWMHVEYTRLTHVINLLERQHNSSRQTYHAKRLELIEIGRIVGIELAPPSYERKMKIEGVNKCQ